jgi:acetyltransferase-like isoleucine patch superfamily enzyme
MRKLIKQLLCYFNYRFLLKNKNVVIEFGATYTKDSQFDKYVKLYKNSNINKSSIGKMSYVGHRSIISRATIGRFCTIAPDVKIGLGVHPTHLVSIHPAFYSTKKQSPICFSDENHFEEFQNITIGSDVWIGANSMILDGVKIGNGVIVGAGAVVTKNIPDYAIVVGVPAKVIKYRFKQEEIDFLLEYKWWDKDMEFLQKNASYFLDVDMFLNEMR